MTPQLTDLQEAGLQTRGVRVEDRALLTTVDFEAFRPVDIERWHAAMVGWAGETTRRSLPTVFFVSVEHVLRLRYADEKAYQRLLDGFAALVTAGCELQPHNHCAFDAESGGALVRGELPRRLAGYGKRPSMFYDVVRRNGIPIKEWIPHVLSEINALRAAVVHPAAPLAFRPGGWDCGDRPEEVADYIRALSEAGVTYESGGSRGIYGTRSWKVGLPFGQNVFAVGESVVVIAPTIGWDCRVPFASPRSLSAATRLLRQWRAYMPPLRAGILTPVLHFDHLLRGQDSTDAVAERAQRAVRVLACTAGRLRLHPATFASLGLVAGLVDSQVILQTRARRTASASRPGSDAVPAVGLKTPGEP